MAEAVNGGAGGPGEDSGAQRGRAILCIGGCLGSMTWLPVVAVIAAQYREGALALADVTPLLVPFLVVLSLAALASALIRQRGRWGRGLSAMTVGLLATVVGAALLLLPLTGSRLALGLLRAIAGALLGMGGGTAAVAWAVRCEGLGDSVRRGVFLAVAVAACLLAALAQARGIDPLLLVVTVGLALLSFALFSASADRDVAPEVPGRTLSGLVVAYGRTSGSYLLFGLAFSMMIMQFLIAQHGRALSWTWLLALGGVAVAGGALAVNRAVAPGRWNWLSVMRFAAVPVLVAFYPFDMGSEFSLWFALGASAVALWAYLAIAAGIADDVAACLHASFSFIWGIALASLAAGAVAGTAVAQVVEVLDMQIHVALTALTAMVCTVLASDVVLTRGSLARAYKRAVTAAGARDGEGSAPDPSLSERIAAVAEACALTEREAEVLGILARGHGLGRVQEALYIAEGTAITHRRHIYQKLAVHSKAELIDFVATFGDDGIDDD